MRSGLLGAALLWSGSTMAGPTLGPAYGDHMVLQRGEPIRLEGMAEAGETVVGSFLGRTASATADADGRFAITLDAAEASEAPAELRLTAESGSLVLSDIMVGDVYLCSGQSNMELPVSRALDTNNQLRRAADNGIRLLKIPKATAPVPQADFAAPVAWTAADSETVAEFSAACFYMGKQLREDRDTVPVGLIHSNWGGSAARAWLAPEGIESLYGREDLALLRQYAVDAYAATQAFVPRWFDWWRANDNGREPWTDSTALDWKPIPQFSFWNEWEGTGLDRQPQANVWLRQSLVLTAQQAERDGLLAIGAIDDLDLTFVNGHPVGYTFGWGVERHYRVPARYLREGRNEILIAANNMWDTGGFYAGPDRLWFEPRGAARIPLGADWEYAIGSVAGVPPRAPWDANAGLGVMHNAMIAPLGAMKIAGVAWYQGESDVGQPGYADRLRELFAGWRRQFGNQARMLVVQLADFGTPASQPAESGWARLRQEQLDAVLADPQAALVTAIDIGEPSDIHPANKNVLGRRLAMAANGEAMPMPRSASLSGDTVTIRLDGIEGGLRAHGGPHALGFELCGDTQESCRYAVPLLDGDAIFIRMDGRDATRVRHAWSDAPVVNLYDARGLPIPGFELPIVAE